MKWQKKTIQIGRFVVYSLILLAVGLYLFQHMRIIHGDDGLVLVQIGSSDSALPVTFTPVRLDISRPDVVNPLRGLYIWRGQEVVPSPEVLPRSAFDAYERYTWDMLEPAPGVYDFSLIDADADLAARQGRRLGLRVRALVAGQGVRVPGYLVEQMPLGWWHAFENTPDAEPDTYVPDWNDPDFMAAADGLIKALGARYNGDPRIAWIDIGIYGNWGEWQMHSFPYPAPTGAEPMTLSNRRQLIDLHMAAFPDTRLIAMSDDVESLVYALQQSPAIGWRRDSLGHAHFESVRLNDPVRWELIRDRWQTAPVIAELIAPDRQVDPDSFHLAMDQIRLYHVSLMANGNTLPWERLSEAARSAFVMAGKTTGYRLVLNQVTVPFMLTGGQTWDVAASWSNMGVAPVYEAWEIVYQLRVPATRYVVWEGVSQLDLRDLLPTTGADGTDMPLVRTDRFDLPDNLSPGDYALTVVVRDPTGYRQPLALAIEGRSPEGFYHLGTVKVTGMVAGGR